MRWSLWLCRNRQSSNWQSQQTAVPSVLPNQIRCGNKAKLKGHRVAKFLFVHERRARDNFQSALVTTTVSMMTPSHHNKRNRGIACEEPISEQWLAVTSHSCWLEVIRLLAHVGIKISPPGMVYFSQSCMCKAAVLSVRVVCSLQFSRRDRPFWEISREKVKIRPFETIVVCTISDSASKLG